MTTTGSAPPPGVSGYLDAASAEPLHPAAREVLLAAYDSGYADPRRLHLPGRNARLLLDNAREAVAEALGVRRDEVSFVGSGTHAVHLGLLGLARARERAGQGVVYSAVEHQSVHHAARWLDPAGDATPAGGPVGVDTLGRVDVDAFRAAAHAGGVAVAALQSANHEVGTVQPVDELDLSGVPLFVDACASMGRTALPGRWTAVAGSAHKWGGPAGVGVLLVRAGARWVNPFPADDRSDDRSTGFENVPAALAAAAALQAVVAERAEVGARQRELIDLVRARVAAIPDVDVVGDPEDRLPHLVTFSVLYLAGDALVTELDRLGFGLASGSACTASTLEPSHVLAAMGALTHGNLRLSLTRDTTRDEIARLLEALPEVIDRLRAETGT
ncbi:MAG: aminotransferase class V-fold PLP-dependent enzyme [Nocardioides sp.]|uniref:cysteine desulfurase family protein n=1 Tax=Nocardioides sp. TaxID=35761 RepID=UPI0039E57C16